MALTIFQGKKRLYNELILRSLISGAKTVKQISEYIYASLKREKKLKPKHNPLNVKRSIYSVIDRPKGRLQELASKGYIEKREGKWQLTLKGFCVALTLFKSLDDVKRVIPVELFDRKLKEVFERIVTYPPFALMRTPYVDDKYKELLAKVRGNHQLGELFLVKLRDYTSELMDKGVNLDDVSHEEFLNLVGVKMAGWFLEYVS